MPSTRTTSSRLAATIVSAALLGAAVAPAAVASPTDNVSKAAQSARTDPRPPDALDRAAGYSPSLEDAGSGASSPDARDRASGYAPTLVPEVEIPVAEAAAAAVPPVPAVPGGFDWVSAGIGAAAGTGLLIMAMAFGTTKLLPGRSRSGVIGA